MGSSKEALDFANRSVELKRDYLPIYILLTEIYFENGNYQRLSETIKKAEKNCEINSSTLNKFADLNNYMGEADLAVDKLDLAGKENPEMAWYYNLKKFRIQNADYSTVLNDYLGSDKESPGSAVWLVDRENRYGGLIKGVKRNEVSKFEDPNSYQLENGHIGGDRMSFKNMDIQLYT